jgi:alkanesulfonate monooxygenase SsuD/methylene tetrahydromethanopterin reductase-like flavin-dependent oxidoreductase (luciferase family)
MQFGIFQSAQWPEGSTQQVRLHNAVEQSVLAEVLGFDSVFMTEHHFSRHGIVSDNIAMLAYIAAKTSRIRLGTAVSVLPLHDPVRLAESIALTDILSGGRLDFGIGRGYQWGEFNGFGIDLEDRAAMFDEAIGIILQSWAAESPFTHTGKYWQYRDALPQPRPLQGPHPPIWMATTSEDGFEQCVKNNWGVMLPQAVSMKLVASWVASYKSVLDRHEKSFDPRKLILARGLHLGSNDAVAWSEGSGPYLEFLELAQSVAKAPNSSAPAMSFDATGIADNTMICGPARCIEQLEMIRELGIEYVIFFSNTGGLDHHLVMESLQRFSTDVMPKMKHT